MGACAASDFHRATAAKHHTCLNNRTVLTLSLAPSE